MALLCQELTKHFVLLFRFILAAALEVVSVRPLSMTKQSRSSSGTDALRELEEEPWKLGNSREPGGQKRLSHHPHTPPFLLPLPVDFLLFQSGEFLNAMKKQATLDSITKFLQLSFKSRLWRKILCCSTCIWGSVLGQSPGQSPI